MSNETYMTVKGRLTADPELRYTPSGAGVVNFTVAVQAQKFDKNTNEWKDQATKFWRCAAWNRGKLILAENIADQLKKSDNVVVYGELTTREYEKDGEKRYADEIRVEAIGKDLTFHGQAYTKNQPAAQQQDDPWANAGAGQGVGWAGDASGAPF